MAVAPYSQRKLWAICFILGFVEMNKVFVNAFGKVTMKEEFTKPYEVYNTEVNNEVIITLRGHIKELIAKHPCATPEDGSCHCETCTAQHALSYTSGFESGLKPEEKNVKHEFSSSEVMADELKHMQSCDDQKCVRCHTDLKPVEKEVK